jgi:3-dehydroquinate dehydratase-1
LAVAVLTEEASLLSDARLAKRHGAAALEIRADHFPRASIKPQLLRDKLASVRKTVPLPIILTLRLRREGGRLPRGINEQDRLRLIRAALSEVAAVDVELAADGINGHVVSEAHKRGRWAILSAHDFRKTPTDRALRALVRKARRLRGDVLKVAAQASTRGDAARLMAFCREAPFRFRAFLPMGPHATRFRLAGYESGSCLSYGFLRRSVAPGQPSVRRLARLFRHARLPRRAR